MARVRPKAETNFRYYRVKHLVHYMNLTPFIKNNTHNNIIIYNQRAGNEWRNICGKIHTLKLAHIPH